MKKAKMPIDHIQQAYVLKEKLGHCPNALHIVRYLHVTQKHAALILKYLY